MGRLAWICQLWEIGQVELHGHYSIAHLKEFERYHATTSWLRVLLVCALTPLPCIALVFLLDALPLEPLEKGTRESPHFWIRSTVTIFLLAVSTLEQFIHHLPQLQLRRWQILIISGVATAIAMPFNFQMTLTVGYPMPFMMIVGTGPWTAGILSTLYAFKRRLLHETRGLVTNSAWYFLLCICQITMTIVYPVFNYLYKSLSSTQQTGAILLLPVIKLVAKNWISYTLPDLDDAKPEAVVFNVEIFHALFVALCMGNTTSIRTIVALMAIDLLQAWLSYLDILAILQELKPMIDKLQATRDTSEQPVTMPPVHYDLMATASRIVELEPFQAQSAVKTQAPNLSSKRWSMAVSQFTGATDTLVHSVMRRSVTGVFHSRRSRAAITPVGLGPTIPNGPPVSTATRIKEKQLAMIDVMVNSTVIDRGLLVGHTQKLLFVTEFVVLIEYVEVIMPMMYSVCVTGLNSLPNRRYYLFLDGINSGSDLALTVGNVMLYATLECFSLLFMTLVLWGKLRVSLLHQLAFILEQRVANIQAKMFLWLLNVMQNSLVHVGFDYSMRFAWLTKPLAPQ